MLYFPKFETIVTMLELLSFIVALTLLKKIKLVSSKLI